MDRTVRKRDEKGYVRLINPLGLDIVLLLVVGMVVWAAIASQLAANKVVDIQKDMAKNQTCSTQVLFDVVTAANDRTTYSADQANANIKAWQAQFDVLTLSQNPHLTPKAQLDLYNKYVEQVQKYLAVAVKARDQANAHQYPTSKDLTDCLQGNAQPKK